MARLILLDSGPIGLAAMPTADPAAAPCRAWLYRLEAAGAMPIIPAVVDYEVRRELARIGASARLRNLDTLNARFSPLPVSEGAWRRAAGLWAHVRKAGRPTAGPDRLDADAVIAGQALTVGGLRDVVTLATSNVRHMTRFPGLDARDWQAIT